MKKVILISFDPDVDVTRAVKELQVKYPGSEFLIPILEYGVFAKTALHAVLGTGNYHLFFSETAAIDDYAVTNDDITFCSNPIKEILRQVSVGDVLGLVWDDSNDVHAVLHSLEDYGLDTWDITDGLDEIEIDYEDEDDFRTDELHAVMVNSLALFAESLTAYVTSSVMDILTDTIRERLAEEDHLKDISPFDDDR
jgi:hypothetical protein